MNRQQLIRQLVDMQYERNDMVLEPGRFRVRGDTVDIVPSYENDIIRIELAGNTIRQNQRSPRHNGQRQKQRRQTHALPSPAIRCA